VTETALQKLRRGILLEGTMTRPAEVAHIHPDLAPRDPPIRHRLNIPTGWIELTLHEGRNRQVRKMTAAAGLPTLRLLRVAIGQFNLPSDLAPSQWRELTAPERASLFHR
jgi:23S rRNA pseudouridine2457 synthase